MTDVLVIVDMQEGFRAPESEAIIPRIKRVCEQFSQVVYTRFVNTKDSPFRKLLGWDGLSNQKAQEIMREFSSRNTIVRHTYSVLAPEMQAVLRGVSRVYIAGIYTDVCATFCT